MAPLRRRAASDRLLARDSIPRPDTVSASSMDVVDEQAMEAAADVTSSQTEDAARGHPPEGAATAKIEVEEQNGGAMPEQATDVAPGQETTVIDTNTDMDDANAPPSTDAVGAEEVMQQAPEAADATPSDLNVVRAQVEEAGGKEGQTDELQRLRDLVFASRGSKSQLPPGWDDEAGGNDGAQAPVALEKTEGDDAEKSFIADAIKKVGEEMSDSDGEGESSSEESSSSSSSSSDSDDEERGADGEAKGSIQRRKAKPVLVSGYDSDEGDNGLTSSTHGPTTKNEVIEPTVDPPPYSVVPPEHELRPLGQIRSIIDNVVVVAQETGRAPGAESSQWPQAGSFNPAHQPVDRFGRKGEQAGEYSVLDTGSVLALEDRTVLGVVYETFGSVLEPLYALQFSSPAHVNRDVIQKGKAVFYVPAESTYVLTRTLRALGKGSDASNIYDEEVGDDERDFSDDEQEAEYKRAQKAERAAKSGGANNAAANGAGPKGKKRSAHGEGFMPPTAIRHGLPPRPVEGPLHRDADLTAQRSAPLPYDEEVSASPSTTGLADYAQRYASFQQRGRGRGRGGAGAGQHSAYTSGASTDASQGAINPAFAFLRASAPQQPVFAHQPPSLPPQQMQQQQQYQAYFQNNQQSWNPYYSAAINAQQQNAYQAPFQGLSSSNPAMQMYSNSPASGYMGAAQQAPPQNYTTAAPSSYDPAQPQVQFHANGVGATWQQPYQQSQNDNHLG